MSRRSRLLVLYLDQIIGEVERGSQERLVFRYQDAWRSSRTGIALSLSLPIAAAEHAHDPIDAYLWGLLPDNDHTLRQWATRYQVSPKHAFGLIAHVGEDCPGAFQFVREDRLATIQSASAAEVAWTDEAGVAARLRALRTDQAAWRLAGDAGQFSLAGAQPKTALLYANGRWGVPSGRMPTTHILKPPIPGFDGHAENEHLCLRLARALGLATARTEVRRFESEVAIVVTRFDRAFTAQMVATAVAAGDRARAEVLSRVVIEHPILRLHQEDLCQAMGIHPTQKYQNEGGPTPKSIADLLRLHSTRPEEDVRAFFDALVFNWLIGGTDGHAKNYALLHAAGGRVRLAPLYDMASALPYPDMNPHALKLAMKVGSEYKMHNIHARHWRDLALELRLDPEQAQARVIAMAVELPDQVVAVWRKAQEEGLEHPIMDRLAGLLTDWARVCQRRMALG